MSIRYVFLFIVSPITNSAPEARMKRKRHICILVVFICTVSYIRNLNHNNIKQLQREPLSVDTSKEKRIKAGYSCETCTSIIQNSSSYSDICTDFKEDIVCKTRIPFIKTYKNPCWYDKPNHLSCLPYFIILGVQKCGTTDLFASFVHHPDFRPSLCKDGNVCKELHFFDSEYYCTQTDRRQLKFEDYVHYFRMMAKAIRNGNNMAITGDASPSYLWKLYTWRRLPYNKHLTRPRVQTFDLIKQVMPNVKFIIMLRDPVERSHSSYYFRNPKASVENFEPFVYKSISTIKDCFSNKSEIDCLIDSNFMHTYQVEEFAIGLYYFYIKEWMKMFSKEQFLILSFEEYSKDKVGTLNKIFSFLNIGTFSKSTMESLGMLRTDSRNKGNKRRFIPLTEKTRNFLYEFYHQYNDKLYDLLSDFNHRWNKEPYHLYKSRLEKQT